MLPSYLPTKTLLPSGMWPSSDNAAVCRGGACVQVPGAAAEAQHFEGPVTEEHVKRALVGAALSA